MVDNSTSNSTGHRRSGPGKALLQLALVALAYWVAARLSLNLALVHEQVTPIWPPTGIALVAILILGRRVWPAIALAAFLVNLPIGPSPAGAAVIAVGNTLAPLASAELLKRARFRPELDRLRDALAIVFLAALGGMTVSATLGTTVLTLSGTVPVNDFLATWAVWWTGDAMGVLLVAPFLLSLLPRPGQEELTWRQLAELTLLLAGIGVATYLLFQNDLRLEYLVLLLIMVAAWRFRLRGAAPAALVASGVAIWAAVAGAGPFASESLFQKMVTLQVFNVSVALASFVLASFVDTRERQEEMSRQYRFAQQAIEAKSDFLNLAAHEFRGPLTVLTGYLSLLSSGELGPAPERWGQTLEILATKTRELNKIIDDLLEAGRIDGETLQLPRTRIDLRAALQEAAERARPLADLVGAKIELEIPPDPLEVEANAEQVGRILDNLINNGFAYSTRPPLLSMSASSNGDVAVVRVADNGVGIPQAQRERVFEPFLRNRDPRFDNVAGTGLGLYISRQLARAQGGGLAIESSELEQGTTFTLVLPLHQDGRTAER
ncbi:MAG TPA: MASE1 domain-containing protein [Candidatus Dormibacteraeota bacterium]